MTQIPWHLWACLAFCIVVARLLARKIAPADLHDQENLVPSRFHQCTRGNPNIREWRMEKPAATPVPPDLDTTSEEDPEPTSVSDEEPGVEVVAKPRHDENRSETPDDAAEVRAYLRAVGPVPRIVVESYG
ncbi:hypothetical protein ACHAQA_000666 [Verticillium albo-atrum]